MAILDSLVSPANIAPIYTESLPAEEGSHVFELTTAISSSTAHVQHGQVTSDTSQGKESLPVTRLNLFLMRSQPG